MGLMFLVSGYKTLLMMACFHRQRHPHVARGPHAVHRGFYCQLRGTHSPPCGAVCAAAAKAEVFPSQPVSPVAVAAGITGGGAGPGLAEECWWACWPLLVRVCPGKREGPACVKLPGQGVCFCFASVIVILTGSLQIRKLRLREMKSERVIPLGQAPPTPGL